LQQGEVHKLFFGTKVSGNNGEKRCSTEEIDKKFHSSMKAIETLFELQSARIQTLEQDKLNAERQLQVETDKALARLVLTYVRIGQVNCKMRCVVM
jgi:hypothetical protein